MSSGSVRAVMGAAATRLSDLYETDPVEVEMDERMADVIAQSTRRIDHLERESRRWKRINAVISIGALLLLLGGVNRPGTLEAQQVTPTQEGVRAATSRSEA